MPGSLVQDQQVVATWTANKTSAQPILNQWTQINRDSQELWQRFTNWYSHNTTRL
jgi:hypothetical protein